MSLGARRAQAENVVERPRSHAVTQDAATVAVGQNGDGEALRWDDLEFDLEAVERAAMFDDLHAVENADGPTEATPLGEASGEVVGGPRLAESASPRWLPG